MVAPFPLLLPDGLFLPALVFTPSLLLVEDNDGFAGWLIGVRSHSFLRSRSGFLWYVSRLIIVQLRRQVWMLAEGRV